MKSISRIGDAEFDPAIMEKKWGTAPISMKLIEYFGDGDPAFGGRADDRMILANGRVAERQRSQTDQSAIFSTLTKAHEVARQIPNRRPGSILGVAPTWR